MLDARLSLVHSSPGPARRLPETLSDEVLTKMHAPPKAADVPVLEDATKLKAYDGFLFGIPTRFGNFPAQWKVFWDHTGGLWQSGGLAGKYAGIFQSTASVRAPLLSFLDASHLLFPECCSANVRLLSSEVAKKPRP